MTKPTIDFNQFSSLDLRVGQITNVKPVKNSQKLLVFTVDFGPLGTKQVVAGLKPFFDPEFFLNQKFVFITNLPPKPMAGFVSQAMILAAQDDDGNISLIQPAQNIKPGAIIK